MSSFGNITNLNLLGAAAAKDVMGSGKPGGAKGKGPGAAMGPAVGDGLGGGSGIRSAQAGLIVKLKRVNQSINVIMSLEGESSALNNMLGKIEDMIKQGSENLVAGEMNTAKASLTELVKDLMKGINAPIYADASNYTETDQVLAYIGKGFSVDLIEGGIVFDVEKMLEDVYKKEAEDGRRAKKKEEYLRAMGFVKGGLQDLMESLSKGISEAGGLTYILKDIREMSSISVDVIAEIRKDSSMFAKSHGIVDAARARDLLNS